MVKGFTAKDKVVVHLLDFYDTRDKYPQPEEVTQEGIADCIGSKQNTVSYAVRNLVKEGILNENTTRISGKKQRRKGYFLTDKGVKKAREVKEEMEETQISVLINGEEKDVLMKDVNKYLHTNLSMIEILNDLKDGTLELKTQEKHKDFITYLYNMPKPPSSLPDEISDMQRWWSDREKNLLLVEGEDGTGKTSLLTAFAENMQSRSNIFYYKVKEWHTNRNFWNQMAKFMSEAGEHKLSSYLEASITVNMKEALSNLKKDIELIPASLLIIEDIDRNPEIVELMVEMSKVTKNNANPKAICSKTHGQVTKEGPEQFSYQSITVDDSGEIHLLDNISRYYNVDGTKEEILDQVFDTRLTSEEYLALAYVSVFREPVEKSEITSVEGINDKVLKNLQQTPLMDMTIEDKPIIHEMIQDRMLETMSDRDNRVLHSRAAEYYERIPAKTAPESIEYLYHLSRSNSIQKLTEELKKNGEDILTTGFSKNLLDILETIEFREESDERKVVIDYMTGESLRIQGYLDKAESRFETVINSAEDMCMVAKSHEGLGDIKEEEGYLEEAVEEYSEAVQIVEDIGEEGEMLLGKDYFRLAQLKNKQGKYEDAIEHLQKSIDILDMNERYSMLTSAYFLLARIEKGRGRWENALKYFKKGVDNWKEISESYQRVGKLHDIGSFYKVIRELSNAEEFLKETIQTCEKFGYRQLKGQALLTLSECYLEEGDYNEAIEAAKWAEDIFKSLDKEEERGYAHALLGQIYLKLNKEDSAEDHLSRAISIYQKLGSSYSLGLAYFSMAKLQERKGNRQGIADNYRKALLSLTSSGASQVAKRVQREMKTVPISM